MNILQRLNWIDLLVCGIFVRIIYAGMKAGLAAEFIKLMGLVFGSIIALHYYVSLNQVFGMPPEFGYVFFFALLLTVFISSFKFVRDGLFILIRPEAHPLVDKWGSLLIAVFRGLLACSLIVIFLRLTGISYIQRMTTSAITGNIAARFAPSIYENTYEGMLKKLFPTERLNKHALTVGYGQFKE